jgi:hypothetical protein
MVQAVARAGEIKPAACRRCAEKDFSAARMADGYEQLYRSVLESQSWQKAA